MVDKSKGGHMIISFKSYLARLKELEMVKPRNDRKEIPTANQIGQMAGLSQSTTSRLTSGQSRNISIDKVCAILNVMNHLGFGTKVTDFFTYTFESRHDQWENGPVTRIANNHAQRLDYRTANKMIDFIPDEESEKKTHGI